MRIYAIGFAVLLSVLAPRSEQARDAAVVIAEARQALGGSAAIDAVKSFAVDGTTKHTFRSHTNQMSIELASILPDRFLEIRRQTEATGPAPLDITYYRGFNGDTLIKRTDANIPLPPDPYPQTPEHLRSIIIKNRRDFVCLSLLLSAGSFAGVPLQMDYRGTQTRDERQFDVIEVRGPDAFEVRLLVDTATHLPEMIEWQQDQLVIMTTSMSSTVATRGGQVMSQSAPVQGPTTVEPVGSKVTWTLTASKFKAKDGLTWPRRLRVAAAGEVLDETDLRDFKINPKFDARKFDVPR